jgi:hypothetical protein
MQELLDLSVTSHEHPFVVTSAVEWTRYRHHGRSQPAVRLPYNPSFGYALPFHIPPVRSPPPSAS